MTIWLLGMANSATSNVSLVVGVLVLTAAFVPKIRRHLGLYMSAAITVVVIGYALADFAAMMMGALGRDQTLTGRTEIWKRVLGMDSNPLIGVGYGSFWLGDRLQLLWDEYAWHPTQSHNGYIDVYLELGMLGLVLLVGTIVASFRAALRMIASDVDYGSLRLALLTVALLYNITESAFRPGLLMYFVFLMAAVDVSGRAVAETQARPVLPNAPPITTRQRLRRVRAAAARSPLAPSSTLRFSTAPAPAPARPIRSSGPRDRD